MTYNLNNRRLYNQSIKSRRPFTRINQSTVIVSLKRSKPTIVVSSLDQPTNRGRLCTHSVNIRCVQSIDHHQPTKSIRPSSFTSITESTPSSFRPMNESISSSFQPIERRINQPTVVAISTNQNNPIDHRRLYKTKELSGTRRLQPPRHLLMYHYRPLHFYHHQSTSPYNRQLVCIYVI